MLQLEGISAWLKASPRSITTPIRFDVQPDKPDTVITIADTGGYALELEGAMDNPTFQVRCRGPSATQARDLAFLIDGYLLDAEWPLFFGSVWVLKIGRVGGRPSYLAFDEHERTIYTCNYTITSER